MVTDRRLLDQQIKDTIKQFAQVGAIMGHAEHSGDLRRFIAAGKKIIISTVQKFPFILDEIGSEHRGRSFAIDMDSYRVEKRAAAKIQLPDTDAEIEAIQAAGGGRKPEPKLDRLSNILKTFNDQFGNIPWTDADRVHKLITEDIPNRVAADTAYQNAKKNSDKQNARIEHDKALARVMTAVLKHALQAVHGQRVVPAVDDRHGLRAYLRIIGGRSASEHATQRSGSPVDSCTISREALKNDSSG